MMREWIWLTTRKGLGPRGVLAVLESFGSPERAYYAEEEQYRQIPGLSAFVRGQLADKSLEGADRVLGECDRLGLRILTLQDGDYPERLRQLADPPALLYIRGRLPRFDQEAAIGVVGAREPSDYGRQVAPRFGLELARGGALIVSGIAGGIDSLALRGALSGGGTVVSVLAGGVDVIYPRKNRFLYEDVAAAGALISEYPPGTEHKGEHFPVRNRLISGLSLGVLAVECRRHSGTMKTILHAMEQDRDVFAVPGNIDAPLSEGPNWLLQQGAKAVTCARDILEEYWSRFPAKLAPSMPLAPEAAQARLGQTLRDSGLPPAPTRPRPDQTDQIGPASPADSESAPAPGKKARELVPLDRQKARFTDDQLDLLHAMSERGGKPCTADELVERTQIPARRVLSALTMLQVDGAVQEHPGKRFSPLVELERG